MGVQERLQEQNCIVQHQDLRVLRGDMPKLGQRGPCHSIKERRGVTPYRDGRGPRQERHEVPLALLKLTSEHPGAAYDTSWPSITMPMLKDAGRRGPSCRNFSLPTSSPSGQLLAKPSFSSTSTRTQLLPVLEGRTPGSAVCRSHSVVAVSA